MSFFSGIWVPLVTPFHNGEVDFPALQKLIVHLQCAAIAGFVVCGSTGEAAALDDDEQLALLDAVLQLVPGRQVVMGLCGNRVDEVLTRLQVIQTRPIAGLLVPPPYYIRPSQAGVIDFFTRIADASSLPLILYNIPYRTGVEMQLETMRTLARHERIVAVKDCGGDRQLTLELLGDAQLDVLAGEDAEIFSTLCAGGAGAIAASAHIYPERFVELFERIRTDRLSQARELFFEMLPMIRTLFAEPNPAPIKTALALQGLTQDELRPPMQVTSMPLRQEIEQRLRPG